MVPTPSLVDSSLLVSVQDPSEYVHDAFLEVSICLTSLLSVCTCQVLATVAKGVSLAECLLPMSPMPL